VGGTLLRVVALSAFGGVLSAAAASLFVALPERPRQALVPPLVSFATGALLAAACVGLLPEAVHAAGEAGAAGAGLAAVAGMVACFAIERYLLARALHASGSDRRPRATGPMILWGDGLHNAVDGAAIAGAYLTNPALGVATAIAVFAHELPREIGDLAVLLDSGMSRMVALSLNLLVSLAAVAGAVVACLALARVLWILPYALGLAAGTLLYVALANLVPGLQRKGGLGAGATQLLWMLAGIAIIWITQAGPEHGPGH
jgi:zinc and cadmium transporter